MSARLVDVIRLCTHCARPARQQIVSTKLGVPEPRTDLVCESHQETQVRDLTYLGYAVGSVLAVKS